MAACGRQSPQRSSATHWNNIVLDVTRVGGVAGEQVVCVGTDGEGGRGAAGEGGVQRM